jgi:L-iditol 2-dehydrogenase
MQALVLENLRDLHMRNIPEPAIGAEDLLIKVKACGICGSDVHGYDGTTGRRIPPLVMGHEAAGVVEKIGANVHSFRVGDRVTFDSTISCDKCLFCSKGDVNLCDNRQVLGVSCGDYHRDGAFAEYVSVPQHIVYALQDSFPYEKSALIEAVSIAVHAARITALQPGDSAIVIGAGMIGLLAIQAFRIYGCSQIIAVDLEESKLALARQLGADETFLATDPDLSQKLKSSTRGRGPDIAVEVVGVQKAVLTAIENVRRGGTVTLVGNLAPAVEIPLQTVVTRQLRLQGSCASAGEYRECIRLMDIGAINVDPLISAFAPLSEGAKWFNRLYRHEPGLMKVILHP